MPWNLSTGLFERINPDFTGANVWDQDRQGGIKVIATRHDYHDQDIAEGISACLNINGYNTMLANLDMGGNTLVNLAPGTGAGDIGLWDDDILLGSFDEPSRELRLQKNNGTFLDPIVIPASPSSTVEGSWTPQILNATMGGDNNGWYVRDGRLVRLFGVVEWIARVSSNNSVLVSGLPFTIDEPTAGMTRSCYVSKFFPGAGMAVSGINVDGGGEAAIQGILRDPDDPAFRQLVLATYFGTNNPELPDTVYPYRMKTLSAAGKFGFNLTYLTNDPI